ncbi:MAG: hypothetical protein JEZ14_13110 [Marinilabiliaceae bacterium]|nr:hypothetical protein [Marinilabiliaceae bacterium]
MKEIPKGRVFQDETFNIPWFNGIKLEKLIGLEDPDQKNREPIVIYIKGEGLKWQKFFLDVCFGVWENWEEFNKEDDAYWYIDYTDEFQLYNQLITSINCIESQFQICFENGKRLILRYTNPDEFDSDCELLLEEETKPNK